MIVLPVLYLAVCKGLVKGKARVVLEESDMRKGFEACDVFIEPDVDAILEPDVVCNADPGKVAVVKFAVALLEDFVDV